MSASTYSSSGVASYASPPSIDNYTKSFDSATSDRIGELQRFLLGSDWSSLSSLSPPTASIRAVVDETHPWPTAVSEAPLFASSTGAVKPATQSAAPVSPIHMPDANNAVAHVAANAFATDMSGTVTAPAVYQPALTPPHRHSFDTCYSDSVGSPDSERDFLTSPSMFDDAEFEFDADILANNFPLFGDQPFEDGTDAPVDDPIGAFAYNLENVKLESEEHDSQLSESDFGASQSTIMPSQGQSQVKTEPGLHDSTSTLEAAFKAEHDATKFEPKHEQDIWSSEELKPYFSDEENKAVLLSTLANAFGDSTLEKEGLAPASFPGDEQQHASQAGPVRSLRANRERRSSPSKVAAYGSGSASPAPFIDPTTNTKRWQCADCGKLFDRAYNLKTHRYTHQDPETRARPFICPDVDCQKQFARKHDMQRHHENVHRGESRRARGGTAKRSRADDLG